MAKTSRSALFVKLLTYGGATGISVSVILYPLIHWATSHPYSRLGAILYGLLPYLWPTAPLMMFVEARPDRIVFGLGVLALAILGNGAIYAAVASVIWVGLWLFRFMRRGASRPHP